MAGEPEVRIVADQVSVRQGRRKLAEAPLEQVMDAVYRAGERSAGFQIRPHGARVWEERSDAVAAAGRGQASLTQAGDGVRQAEHRVL